MAYQYRGTKSVIKMVRKLLVLSLEARSNSIPLLPTDKIVDSAFDRGTDSWEVLVERTEDIEGDEQ